MNDSTGRSPAPARPTSCALLGDIVRGARIYGLPVDSLSDRLPFPLDALRDRRASVDWSDACALLVRLEELAGGADGLYRLGRWLGRRGVLGSAARLAHVAITPQQLYELVARWYGPANVSTMQSDLSIDDDGRIHLTTAVDARSPGSPQLFHVSHGALETLPVAIGLREATVVAEISPRRAAFAITPPPAAGLVERIRRRFGLIRGAGWTIDELAHQQKQLRESHERLEASEDRFRRLAESTHDMIAEWNEEGRCVYVSPNVERIVGCTPDEFRADAWTFLHPDDAGLARDLLSRRFETKGSGGMVFRLRCADDEYRWFENTSNTTTTETGEHRVVTVSRDITKRRELEMQLAQSQKLEALGRLAGGVAHDFNNLLTIIGGASEALLAAMPEGSGERDDAEMILDAADRAAALTRQLLTFGRQHAHERRPLDLGVVARDMEQMLARLVPNGVELSIDVDDDLSLVLADAGQIEQVIVNLTTNAIDAMRDGGALRIALRNVELSADGPTGSSADHPSGPHVELQVVDDGAGIDGYTLTRIFDPFFTTKETGRGTGLGLATVHGVVEQLGGRVSAKSAVGEGTTISVVLPAHQQKEEKLAAVGASTRPTGSERILLVDDEPAGLSVIRRQLSSLGYDVATARNADEALLRHRERGPFDLLVTDIAMPGRDGLRLAAELRERDPALKLLFMSGFAEQGFGNALLAPERNLLTKPFRAGTLARKVRETLDG